MKLLNILNVLKTPLRGPLRADKVKFSQEVEILSRVEFFFFLGSLSTSTRIENKNISTQAEIRNTFAVYLTSWFANQKHCWKNIV